MNEQRKMTAWLKTRPQCVQDLAREFPLGSTFDIDGETLYLVGYNEGDMLIVSPISLADDYDAALEQKLYVHASHFRLH